MPVLCPADAPETMPGLWMARCLRIRMLGVLAQLAGPTPPSGQRLGRALRASRSVTSVRGITATCRPVAGLDIKRPTISHSDLSSFERRPGWRVSIAPPLHSASMIIPLASAVTSLSPD
jgi:hypothetical protein